jgi:hypothetical protein
MSAKLTLKHAQKIQHVPILKGNMADTNARVKEDLLEMDTIVEVKIFFYL